MTGPLTRKRMGSPPSSCEALTDIAPKPRETGRPEPRAALWAGRCGFEHFREAEDIVAQPALSSKRSFSQVL